MKRSNYINFTVGIPEDAFYGKDAIFWYGLTVVFGCAMLLQLAANAQYNYTIPSMNGNSL